MKIFSIILTTSFFLSLPSISSAESIYTVTNKSEYITLISIDENRNPLWGTYALAHNNCVTINSSQFDSLRIQVTEFSLGLFPSFKDLCNPDIKDGTCQPDNYEIVNEPFLSFDDYELTPVDQLNTDCIDLVEQQQMRQKAQAYN